MQPFFRTWHLWALDEFIDKRARLPLSTIALEMWSYPLIMLNLTDANKTEDEIRSAEAEFRQIYLDASYQPDEVKNEVYVVDNSNHFVPLISQIPMFPEVGKGRVQKKNWKKAVRLTAWVDPPPPKRSGKCEKF